MKLINSKLALSTLSFTMMSTLVGATSQEAANDRLARGLGDWVTIVAELLTFVCLVIFIIYGGRFFAIKPKKDEECDEKVMKGVRNAMMTALVGIALAQAALIVARLCF